MVRGLELQDVYLLQDPSMPLLCQEYIPQKGGGNRTGSFLGPQAGARAASGWRPVADRPNCEFQLCHSFTAPLGSLNLSFSHVK